MVFYNSSMTNSIAENHCHQDPLQMELVIEDIYIPVQRIILSEKTCPSREEISISSLVSLFENFMTISIR